MKFGIIVDSYFVPGTLLHIKDADSYYMSTFIPFIHPDRTVQRCDCREMSIARKMMSYARKVSLMKDMNVLT